MIHITVFFFATIRAIIGQKSLTLSLPSEATVRDVKTEVVKQFPEAAGAMKIMLASVNRNFSAEDAVVPDQAEVAFFPHVGGG